MSALLDLNWAVFVTPGIPTVTSDLPPGTKQQMWSPTSSTLVYGKWVVVELGHTDTDYTTCLHVPSVGLVVAGDAAYNDVHQWLAESNAQTRREWISTLDTIESLNPPAVIAGHKRPGKDDSPKIIEETRQYIRDFDRLAGTTTTARELYDKILELYPDRVNPGGALWISARAVKP